MSAADVEVPIVRFDAEGAVVDTVGAYTYPLATPPAEVVRVGAGQYIVPRPVTDEPLALLLPDGQVQVDRRVAEASGEGTFRVTRLGFDGDTIYSRVFRHTPVPYPDALLEQWAGGAARPGTFSSLGAAGEIVRSQRHPADSARAHAVIRREIDHSFPPFQPPIAGGRGFRPYHIGEDGGLWLRREDTGAETFEWLGLAPDGTPIGVLALPRFGFRILWSDTDTVWGVDPNGLGIPWLVRYRIRPE